MDPAGTLHLKNEELKVSDKSKFREHRKSLILLFTIKCCFRGRCFINYLGEGRYIDKHVTGVFRTLKDTHRGK